MFEKEAEEYAHTKHCEKCSTGHCAKKCILVDDDCKTFKDGADFGYNKANEWHYVKDGNPKNENDILCRISKDEVVVGYYHSAKKRYITIDGQDIYNIIAWKEIVLPELLKED